MASEREHPTPPRKRRWRRLRLVTLLLLIGMGCVAVAGLAYRTWFLSNAERQVAEAAAALDLTDPGWRWEDILAARTPLPPEENSAPLVLAIAELLPEEWPTELATTPEHVEPIAPLLLNDSSTPDLLERIDELEPVDELDDGSAADLRAELDALSQPLEAARRLASAPLSGSPEMVWVRKPVAQEWPHLWKTRCLVKLLELHAMILAHERDGAAALARTRQVILVTRSLGDHGSTFSLNSRRYCMSRALAALERTLAQTEPRVDALVETGRLLELERSDADRSLLPALRTERASIFRTYGLVAAGELSLEEVMLGRTLQRSAIEKLKDWLYIGPRVRLCQGIVLREMTRVVDVVRLPLEEQVDGFVSLHEELQALHDDYTRRGDWRVLSTLLVVPLIQTALTDHAFCHKIDAALVALAAERFRLQDGRWPESLEDLVPSRLSKAPRDHCGSGPLRMARTADGLVIYSFGSNRQDDGGEVGKHGADVGFRLWDPEKRRRPWAVYAPARDAERAELEAGIHAGWEDIESGRRELSAESIERISDEAREAVRKRRGSKPAAK